MKSMGAVLLLLTVAGWWPGDAGAQVAGLATARDELFAGAGQCATCHGHVQDGDGRDVSMVTDWRSTMMANAARDPVWQAKVESEVARHPALQQVIEDKCTTCHTPQGRVSALAGGAASYALATARQEELAMEGVACTLCHQIQGEGLGADASFSGHYAIAPVREIYGPYRNVVTAPMRNRLNYTPLFGEHIQASELCATCHTLFTPYVDDAGEVAGTFPEQTPYLEWRNSAHADEGRSCQDCHMPRLDEPLVLSNVPANLAGQSPFWRHVFVGGNVYMVGLLQQHAAALGVPATAEQLSATEEATRAQLASRTAALGTTAQVQDGVLEVEVTVRNLGGHKFPTAYPSRRAWLHLWVEDESGAVVFESGAFDNEGRIVGLETFQPHHDEITRADQVQVYETIMGDVHGAPTWGLLRAAAYIKDNRLPPRGFRRNGPDYPNIAVHGLAAEDVNFGPPGEGAESGTDRVSYRVGTGGRAGDFSAHVELLYQSLQPRFVDDLRRDITPATTAFGKLYDEAANLPARVARSSVRVTHPTAVTENETSGQPQESALLPAYPNPFNASAELPFVVAESGPVALEILDVGGARVRVLVQDETQSGQHTVQWDGNDESGRAVASGVYLSRLRIDGHVWSRRLMVLR